MSDTAPHTRTAHLVATLVATVTTYGVALASGAAALLLVLWMWFGEAPFALPLASPAVAAAPPAASAASAVAAGAPDR